MKNKINTLLNPDVWLQTAMRGLISLLKRKSKIVCETYSPDKKLKLLFAGYAGARNTGGDVRVEEMIRQVRHILGDDNIDLSILTIDPLQTKNYFDKVKQVKLPEIFPMALYLECPKHHGVIACEGSMFKSKFADALSTMMAGSLGLANAEKKLSVGYGAEAGTMNPPLESFVKDVCQQSLVLCRNNASIKKLDALGIRTTPGTDTAWTFSPSPSEKAVALLKKSGWDGQKRILAISPIHPFCWPVTPNLKKFFQLHINGRYKNEHYKSVYFHTITEQNTAQYKTYIQGIANAVSTFVKEHDNVFPILIGMEKVDRLACLDLQKALNLESPMFISDEYDIQDMVAILRCAWGLISSRFHAIVCSMPGLVPSIGITMDERIHNLMNQRQHQHLLMNVDDVDLSNKCLSMLSTIHEHHASLQNEVGAQIPIQLRSMGEMGIAFEDEVRRVYPNFPLIPKNRTWDQYLPPLDDNLKSIIKKFG